MKLKTLSLMLTFLFSISGFSQGSHHDHPSTHGMLIVGKGDLYISHLPMFHSPHDYQVIMKIQLDPAARAQYLSQLESSTETVYTLVPETFVLPDMVDNPRPFKAEIYKGHFERGGHLIAPQVTVTIETVLFFKKFIPGEIKPAQGSYLLFGSNAEPFAAHLISSKPDFDQILQLKPISLDAVILDPITTQHLTVPSTQPLPPDSTVQAQVTNLARAVTLKVSKSLYLETGDLSF